MKVIESSVEIFDQGPGLEGMYKHIERCGRVAYKSEDRMTANSWVRFLKMLYDRGHWAVFNLGTVYLRVPALTSDQALEDLLKNRWSRVRMDSGYYYITTDYRVICQLGLKEFMEKFWYDPCPHHYHRVTSHWVCSRSTSHQLVRHSAFRFIQESQRYVNYDKEKNGGGITYILPFWIYRIRDEVGSTIDSLTGEDRKWILSLSGQELWDTLCRYDRTVSGRNKLWKDIEEEYREEVTCEDGTKLKPEEARGVLCNDTKTELCMCGYLEDWLYEPDPEKTSEKAGFFYLRCAPDAQSDIRVLSQSLKDQYVLSLQRQCL